MLSTSSYSYITGRHFEETSNGYRASFYGRDEISIERVSYWIDSCLPNERYHQLIYSDPASWDMFIFYFPEDGLSDYYSFQFSVIDSTVRLYVLTDDSSSAFFSEYLLIRIQAPSRGTWPNASEFYINGNRIERQVG